MKRIQAVLAVLALAFVFSAGDAWAQEPVPETPPTALRAGRHSLSFSLPSGGSPYAPASAGYWMMLTHQLNLGINVGFDLDRTDTGGDDVITEWDLVLAPTIKYYMSRIAPVAPYVFGQAALRLTDDGIEGSDMDTTLGAAVGFGVEWFPVPYVSFGGHIGVGADIIREDPGEPIAVRTFTSGLSFQVYF